MKKVDAFLLRIAFLANTLAFFYFVASVMLADKMYRGICALITIFLMLNVRYLARLIRQEVRL